LWCFPNYYSRYLQEVPFSGESFFDWLDFGSGKDILEKPLNQSEWAKEVTRIDEPITTPPSVSPTTTFPPTVSPPTVSPTTTFPPTLAYTYAPTSLTPVRGYKNGMGFLETMKWDAGCNKKHFTRDKCIYFEDWRRINHEIEIAPSNDGNNLIARYKVDGKLLPNSKEDEPHTYVWALDKKWYVVDDSWDKDLLGTIKHTSLLAAKPALSAGRIYMGDNGLIWGIDFSSGHYRPEVAALGIMYQWMKNLQFNLTALHWLGREQWVEEECDDDDCCEKYEWSYIDIPGIDDDADTLQRSCFEATLSPTWIATEDDSF